MIRKLSFRIALGEHVSPLDVCSATEAKSQEKIKKKKKRRKKIT